MTLSEGKICLDIFISEIIYQPSELKLQILAIREGHFDLLQGLKPRFLSVPLLWGPAIALQGEKP